MIGVDLIFYLAYLLPNSGLLVIQAAELATIDSFDCPIVMPASPKQLNVLSRES
ncbi:hypothetical protein [Floridanema aerugineum]|uniref:hypothetical protein n=1 Tax=Floridanema aerugineum TaxID=3396169 RepID=UPI0039A520AF